MISSHSLLSWELPGLVKEDLDKKESETFLRWFLKFILKYKSLFYKARENFGSMLWTLHALLNEFW